LIAVVRVKRRNPLVTRERIVTITAIRPVVAEKERGIESSSAVANLG